MTLRLKRLESLVHELAATKQSDGKTMPENVPRPIDKPHPDDDQKPLPAYGSLVATPLGPQYISIGHWEAALNDVRKS